MRFIFRAQERNMTNGDFAFFTFETSYRASFTESWWEYYNVDPADRAYRRQAFYAVKRVRIHFGLTENDGHDPQIIGVGDGGGGHMPPPKNRENIFRAIIM